MMYTASVTSITPTRLNDAYLVSTLESQLLLMDKGSGKLLQSFTSSSFTNTSYRLRSTLGASDALAMSGSEDGRIFVWDVLAGTVTHELWHDESFRDENMLSNKRKVVGAVSVCGAREEWCSAAGDGKFVFDDGWSTL